MFQRINKTDQVNNVMNTLVRRIRALHQDRLEPQMIPPIVILEANTHLVFGSSI